MEELLNQVAEMRGMPASLVKRSAQARADKEGMTLEAVLAEWAAQGEEDASESEETPTEEAATEEAAATDEVTSDAEPAGDTAPSPSASAAPANEADTTSETTTERLIRLAADAKGMPRKLTQTSAKARAELEGVTINEILAGWAGVEVPAEPDPVASTATTDPAAAVGGSTEAPPAAPVDLTDQLVKLAADAKRMPPKLILSSGKVRATHAGVPLNEVLAEWAGVDLEELKQQAPAPVIEQQASDDHAAPEPEMADAVEAPAEPEAETDAEGGAEPEAEAETAAAPVVGITMDELLEKVSQAKGMPEALAKRSAEARAKKTGEALELVLAEWAGIDPKKLASFVPAPPPPPKEVAAPEPADTASDDTSDDAEEKAPAAEKKAPARPSDVEVIEAAAPAPEPEPEPTPDPEDVDTTPLKMGRYPAWLAAAFLIIPLLAVTYILISPNGPQCGTSGQLLVDPVTGNAVNCDGSEYGTVATDYFGNGAAIYAQCQACHGSDGSGGAGPAFAGGEILVTFPAGSCADQIEWITLGTAGWPDPTYGASNKPVGGFGMMPGFGTSLDETQIAEVALYERVQFGGEDLAQAEADCGFTYDGTEPADDADGATQG